MGGSRYYINEIAVDMPVINLKDILKIHIYLLELLYCKQFCEALNPGKLRYKDDYEILEALRLGNVDAFDQIYIMYREDFLKNAAYKFNQIPKEDLVDAWQDSVIAFFTQIRSGKINNLSCSLRSYLFLIGYRYIIKYNRRYIKESSIESVQTELNSQSSILELEWEKPFAEEKEILNTVLELLPEQTRRMLVLRYIEEKTIEEIKQELNYSSPNAVSVSLSRGLAKLRALFLLQTEKRG